MSLPVNILKQSFFLAGPTASGKTAVSLSLARRLNAEIISLDSMAIYVGMDIGTAKPSVTERAQVRHHLIDVALPSQEFSVAEFVRMAVHAAEEIVAAGRTPLFVGGTGLYLRSLLRGLFEGPEADWALREQLQQQASVYGNEWLHAQLAEVDPVTAARLHPNDVRRIVRALEVFRLTGIPLSKEQTQNPRPANQRPRAVVWLDPPRQWLHDRINQRVDQMVELGLQQEVKSLLQLEPAAGRTATQGLGYREMIDHFNGRCSLNQAIDLIKTGTRQFAKRQHTWFRNLEECHALRTDGNESPEQLSNVIVRLAEDNAVKQ